MGVSAARHNQLYNRAREVLGDDEAATLMELLPTSAVATEASLLALKETTEASFVAFKESTEARFQSIETRLSEISTRLDRFFVAMVVAGTTISASLVAAAAAVILRF